MKNVDIDRDGTVITDILGTTRALSQVRIYSFPCCSKSNGNRYIIGMSLHTYYRKHGIRCVACPDKHSICDTCFGTTNNGVYDVVSMFEGPLEVDMRHVCLECFSDNRKDSNAPMNDLPVVNNRVQGNPDDPCLIPCATCGLKPDWRFCPDTELERNYHVEQLSEMLTRDGVPKNHKIRFYYMLDDCISCT